MTQSQLARGAFSAGFISLVETGRSHLSLRTARIIAGRLGIPLAILLDDTPPSAADIRGALRSALEHAAALEQLARAARTELETLVNLRQRRGRASPADAQPHAQSHRNIRRSENAVRTTARP
jgi:transcriptional regulator with XRE-family HTH domain